MVSGYTLTVVGMGVVFSALGLLAVIAWGLERIFRTAEPPEQTAHDEPEPHVEVAIACALAYHLKRKGSIHFDAVTESMWIQQGRIYHDQIQSRN
ncbi:MAG: OadG family transporter subunit [Candidatus Methanofastidiosia archaeon]